MESANSGSIQSSSGGDEEFDSRQGTGTDPLLSFYQPNTGTSSGTGAPTLPFYSLSDFSPSPLLPFDPTTTNIGNQPSTAQRSFMPSPPPSFTLNTSRALTNNPSSSSSSAAAGTTANMAAGGPQRTSRKRTRASRRAPTTVLTTDTSNFRAMVQEFTGIPAPPFAPSLLTRSRFDHNLFSSASHSSLPPYLLRPFAQKLSTGAGTGIMSNTASSVDGLSVPVTTNMAGPGSSNLGPGQANDHQAQALLNMQNPMLTFQSLLQSQHQLQQPNARSLLNFASRSTPQSMPGSNDFLGSSNLQQGLMGADQGSQLHQGGWMGAGSSTGRDANQLNSVVGTERMASTSCSDFVNVSKEQETAVVSTRGEGMVDSWLCSSSSDR